MASNPFKLVFFLEKILTKIETFLLSSILIIMLTVGSIQVFLRKFSTAWGWADELNQNLVVWLGFLGAILAVKLGRHLTIEVLTNFIPKESRVRPLISFFVLLFILTVTGILTSVSWEFFQYRLASESDALLFPGFPKAYMSVIFPVGFGMVFLHYFFRMVELFYNFGGGDEAYPKSSDGSDIDISIKIKMP